MSCFTPISPNFSSISARSTRVSPAVITVVFSESAETFSAGAARETTTTTCPKPFLNMSESSGISARESTTTRIGWAGFPALIRSSANASLFRRRDGSSEWTVPIPTSTASDSARSASTRVKSLAPEIFVCLRSGVDILPSALMAALIIT